MLVYRATTSDILTCPWDNFFVTRNMMYTYKRVQENVDLVSLVQATNNNILVLDEVSPVKFVINNLIYSGIVWIVVMLMIVYFIGYA